MDQTSLVARVKSMLRVKELHDRVAAQAADLASWNKTLEQRVADQLTQIERAGRLKRFLAPQIAELILGDGDERVLESHRRDVTVVFCDLRGFTAFAETAEPEEVMAVLREYHAVLGALIHKHEGTLERFLGDGLMVLFNDPLRCPDPPVRAVKMAVEMRDAVAELTAGWRKHGHELGFGMGIAHGYATLGRIGFEGRFDYSAIGTVVNLAARLCSQAAGRPNPDRPQGARGGRDADRHRAGRRTDAQGTEPRHQGIQHRRISGCTSKLMNEVRVDFMLTKDLFSHLFPRAHSDDCLKSGCHRRQNS